MSKDSTTPAEPTKPPKPPKLIPKLGLSIDETCEASGLGRTWIYEAIGDGKLIAKKAGRRTIILPKHLEAYLESLPAADFASAATA